MALPAGDKKVSMKGSVPCSQGSTVAIRPFEQAASRSPRQIRAIKVKVRDSGASTDALPTLRITTSWMQNCGRSSRNMTVSHTRVIMRLSGRPS